MTKKTRYDDEELKILRALESGSLQLVKDSTPAYQSPPHRCRRHFQKRPAPEYSHFQSGSEKPSGARTGRGDSLPDTGRQPAAQICQRTAGESSITMRFTELR